MIFKINIFPKKEIDRYSQINKFLKMFRDIYLQNPNVTIHNSDTFYKCLSSYNIKNSTVNFKKYHFKWIDFFRKINNIKVFVSENWQYFCQFKNETSNNPADCLKIYISVDEEHIYQAAIELFNYLAQNDIKHSSKIASENRTDDIVIRLENYQDYKKIKDFVTKSKVFQRGKQSLNPFVLTDNVLGYTFDGKLSYNKTVSKYLADYFKWVRLNKQLKNVSVQHFLIYLINMYKNVFQSGININEYFENFDVRNMLDLVNYEQITKLLITSIQTSNQQFDMDILKKFNQEFNDENLKNRKMQHLNNLVSKQNISEDFSNLWDICIGIEDKEYSRIIQNTKDISREINIPNIDKYDYILQWLNYLKTNIKSTEKINEYIKLACDNHYLRAITRTNNLRYIFYKYITPDDIKQVLKSLNDNEKSNPWLSKYGNEIFESSLYLDLQQNIDSIDLPLLDKNYIIQEWFYYLATNKKKFPEPLKNIISACSGNINAITRDRNFRYIFYKYITPDDIKLLINHLTNGQGIEKFNLYDIFTINEIKTDESEKNFKINF